MIAIIKKYKQYLNSHQLFILLGILTLIPFLILSFFNHPATDDYYFSYYSKLYTTMESPFRLNIMIDSVVNFVKINMSHDCGSVYVSANTLSQLVGVFSKTDIPFLPITPFPCHNAHNHHPPCPLYHV